MGHPLARLEPEARHPPIHYALPYCPARVIDLLLSDPRVTPARLSTLGTVRKPGTHFVLERGGGQDQFLLACRASEPGVWEPGAYAVLEGRIEPGPHGSELTLRFRLHPLTRAAYLTVLLVAALIIPLQMWTTGLLLGTVMMFPIVLAAAVIGLDSRRLGEQRASLQRLVEEVFEPLALAREPCERGPFRSLAIAGHAPSESASKRGTARSRSRLAKQRSR